MFQIIFILLMLLLIGADQLRRKKPRYYQNIKYYTTGALFFISGAMGFIPQAGSSMQWELAKLVCSGQLSLIDIPWTMNHPGLLIPLIILPFTAGITYFLKPKGRAWPILGIVGTSLNGLVVVISMVDLVQSIISSYANLLVTVLGMLVMFAEGLLVLILFLAWIYINIAIFIVSIKSNY